MTISTNAAIEFFGTQDTVTAGGGTASVVDGAFSVAGDVVSGGWTNDDDAPMAAVVLTCAFGTAPTANTTVNLYARLMNINGTSDALTPDADNTHVYLGSFLLDDTTAQQNIPLDVRLPNQYSSQVYEFYVENNGVQTMSAGWTLKVTPKTIGPHA